MNDHELDPEPEHDLQPDYEAEIEPFSAEEWWIASLGDYLIWARMRTLETGAAEILSADGEYTRYDNDDGARMALLDAAFRAFDGLDEEDAAMLGFDLESVEPPRAETDDDVLPLMTEKLTSRNT
jgi:hypothetical protein